MTAPSAADFLPERITLGSLRRAAESCRGCKLYRHTRHVVFGEGPASARLMIVGEVPGDREDDLGRPFVGPAGKLLDEGLASAGLERHRVFLTNAVKHFKWEPRGKRRLHARPSAREITACRPWLEAEIDVVQPRAIVCLGAVAAQALLGRGFRVTRQRGEVLSSSWAKNLIATWHPAAILRAPDHEARRRMRDEFFGDLQTAASSVETG